MTRVMVVGGPTIMATFFRAGAVDRIAWFRAPALMGGDGMPAINAFGVDRLSQIRHFARKRTLVCAPDVLEIYERAGSAADAGEEG
jgi:diaminohydroxyphosphoribosylaminopyrimidine deaminase/5-amino-6-(5-phosphoribosylamino)uracil reductase